MADSAEKPNADAGRSGGTNTARPSCNFIPDEYIDHYRAECDREAERIGAAWMYTENLTDDDLRRMLTERLPFDPYLRDEIDEFTAALRSQAEGQTTMFDALDLWAKSDGAADGDEKQLRQLDQNGRDIAVIKRGLVIERGKREAMQQELQETAEAMERTTAKLRQMVRESRELTERLERQRTD